MSGEPIQIRDAGDTDISALAAIEAEVAFNPWSAEQFRQSLDEHRITVAVLGGRVVGYSVVARVLDEAELLNIAVAPGVQGRGLGGKLLDRCLAVLEGQVKKLFLEVRTGNRTAVALYRSRGLHRIATRKGYYPGKTRREDAWVMVYEFH